MTIGEDDKQGAEIIPFMLPLAQPTPSESAGGDTDPEKLVIDIEGFEGPLDVLLSLARNQKVDLRQISILALVEQYLLFIAEARRMRLELAADYLVMAAWLAYLKSRLLLPQEESDTVEPTAEEMAARLAHQLARLEAMREVAAQLMGRNRLGRDVFSRGKPEGVSVDRKALYDLTLYEILKAYADHTARNRVTELKIPRVNVFSLDAAILRLERLIGQAIDWTTLDRFMPEPASDGRTNKSAAASMFVAALELTKQGKMDIRQAQAYGPLFLRARLGDDIPS